MTGSLVSKKTGLSLLPILLGLFVVCIGSVPKKPQAQVVSTLIDSLHKQSPEAPRDTYGNTDTVAIQPVFGFRFTVEGDFDGDGSLKVLTEHFYDDNPHQEANKFYSGLNRYDKLVELTVAKAPRSFALCNNTEIDTLHFAKAKQLLGLSMLKNEGDLNGDGTDEVSYVVKWADWSNINTCVIVSFKNRSWQRLYSFRIRDWQIPDLPGTYNTYGPMGLANMIVIPRDSIPNSDSLNPWNHFERFIKPISKNVIEVVYINEEAMTDTMMVDLPKVE